ncbi:MAG: DUF898 family protein [Paludibacter sp.]|nr:DUF898 family protein [Paludibacter sp.]
MKNYFQFKLNGKDVLPVWLLFMVLFLIPYILVQIKIQGFRSHSADAHGAMEAVGGIFKWYGVMIFLLVVEYSILFFFAKLVIEAIEFKETSLQFIGKFGQFLKILIPGFILTIITLGIYGPWFYADICRFFAKSTSHDSNSFEFKGKGGDLFLIVLLAVILPMIAIIASFTIFTFKNLAQGTSTTPSHIALMPIMMFIMILIIFIPYIYFLYKWLVNFKFKEYSIKWRTDFWSSVGKIAIELFLSAITVGIYLPLAGLKLYSYFSERTIASSKSVSKRFGYDIDPMNDFLFIWGQYLLTIITLGIYYPWAFCKISSRILNKTYLEEIEVAE